MMRLRQGVVLAIALCGMFGSHRAEAETVAGARAYEGLFSLPEGPASLSSRRGMLNLFSLRAYEAFTRENNPGEAASAAQQRPGVRAELKFSRTRHRLEYAVSSGVQLDSDGDRRLRLNNQWLEAGARLAVTPRFSLTASPRVAVSPQCVLGLFGSSQLPVDNNLLTGSGGLLSARSNTAWGAAVTAEREVSRRSTLQIAYRHDRLPGASCGVPTADGRASVRVGRRLSRSTQVWFGAVRASGMNRGPDGAAMTTWLAETRLEHHPPAWRRVILRATASPGRTVSGRDASPASVLEGGAGLDYAVLSRVQVGGGYERRLSYPQGSTRPLPLSTWNALVSWSGHGDWQVTGGVARSSATADREQVLVSLNGMVRADLRVAGTPVYVEYAQYSRRDTRTAATGGADGPSGHAIRFGVRLDRALGGGRRAFRVGL